MSGTDVDPPTRVLCDVRYCDGRWRNLVVSEVIAGGGEREGGGEEESDGAGACTGRYHSRTPPTPVNSDVAYANTTEASRASDGSSKAGQLTYPPTALLHNARVWSLRDVYDLPTQGPALTHIWCNSARWRRERELTSSSQCSPRWGPGRW
eukprot:2097257-Rhodomonas_salina.4